MADVSYNYFKQQVLNGAIDLVTATLKLCLVRTGAGHYIVNVASDQFLSAIAAGDRISTSAALTGTSTTAGVFDASDTVFSAVSGAVAGALVLFIDTGSPATSTLIAYFDSYSGLPITPNGGDINIAFPVGTDKIFALVG